MRFSRYQTKYKYTRSYRIDREGITIFYAGHKEEYGWDQVAGWTGLVEEAMSFYNATRENRAIAEFGKRHVLPDDGVVIRLVRGGSINIEVPSHQVAEVVRVLNEYSRHIDP